jgi:glyoxylase-like metal-dependent hydrolase (beta-lactamase superfamily II)
MMTFGRFKISVHNHGFFRLDGGAMFGSVPKSLWSRQILADDMNRIRLATRSLLVQSGRRIFLADVGTGDKWPDKLRRLFDIENFAPQETGFDPAAVTDIILTHLHFDHAGGMSRRAPGSLTDIELCYPEARVFVQADNYESAQNPNPRERASYLKEDVLILEQAKLELTRGIREIYPDIWVHQGNGHTRGLQWIEVKNGAESIAYPSDMIPTSHHLPLPYTMGYDMCVEALLKEKEDFLRRAVAHDWIVVFEHDPEVPAARIKIDGRGRYAVREIVAL